MRQQIETNMATQITTEEKAMLDMIEALESRMTELLKIGAPMSERVKLENLIADTIDVYAMRFKGIKL